MKHAFGRLLLPLLTLMLGGCVAYSPPYPSNYYGYSYYDSYPYYYGTSYPYYYGYPYYGPFFGSSAFFGYYGWGGGHSHSHGGGGGGPVRGR